jgi:hypothetical protein
MAQDSIAYGESLLADIRDRNDKLAKQARKQAKKDAWKSAAVSIGLDVAQNIFTQRENNFLNNEENLANKLRTTSALNESTRYTTADKTAKSFAGGETAYWETQAVPQVESYLKATYADGTYNQNEYNLFKNQLSKQWGQELYKEHQEGLKLTQDFLSAGGGEKDAYINAIKRAKGTGIIGGIANWVGKGTGILNADVHNSTSRLLETSDKLTQYKSAYEGTGDSALSVFIAEQDLLKGVDLGTKAPTFGTPVMQKNDFGGEVPVIPITTYDESGRVKSLSMVSADANGNFNFDTSQASTKRNQFNLLSSQIASSTNKTYLDAGKEALMGIGGDRSEQLTEAFEEIVTAAGHRSTTKTGQEMMLSLNETASSKAGAVIYRAKKEGWATSAEASVIAGEMIVEAYTGKTQHRVLADAGLGNPYHTMFAIESAINSEKINNSDGIGQLGGSENLMNLYQAYRTETVPGRAAIDNKLKDNNYFEGKVGPLFKNIHTTIKSVVDKGVEGTEENLVREYDNLFNSKPAPVNSAVSTETKEVVLNSSVDEVMSNLPIPPAASKDRAERRKDNLGRKQRLDYMGLLKASKELQRVLNLDKSILTGKAYEKLLNKAQEDFKKQAAVYKKMYG